jgi:hypothetical protein
MHDYKTVKLYLDTLNAKLQAQLDSTGTYTIPYTELKRGKKHLIFFGAVHVRDINHPQFPHLVKAFNTMTPEIAFNEGGKYRQQENMHQSTLPFLKTEKLVC